MTIDKITVSAGCSFYNVTVSFDDGTWKTTPVSTTRKDKNGHLTRRCEISIMADVNEVVEKSKQDKLAQKEQD